MLCSTSSTYGVVRGNDSFRHSQLDWESRNSNDKIFKSMLNTLHGHDDRTVIWPSVLSFLFLLFSLALNAEAFKQYRVQGSSMQPAFQDGDVILIQSVPDDYVFHHHELVSVQFSQRQHPMLKRIFAMPGDRLEIKHNQFVLNGTVVIAQGWSESYQLSDKQQFILQKQLSRNEFILPHNEFVVLGDNYYNSMDSLDYGLIDRRQIVGVVVD